MHIKLYVSVSLNWQCLLRVKKDVTRLVLNLSLKISVFRNEVTLLLVKSCFQGYSNLGEHNRKTIEKKKDFSGSATIRSAWTLIAFIFLLKLSYMWYRMIFVICLLFHCGLLNMSCVCSTKVRPSSGAINWFWEMSTLILLCHIDICAKSLSSLPKLQAWPPWI